MRLRIVTHVLIDVQTGETQAKATFHVEGAETGLGPSLNAAVAALVKTAPPPPPSDYAEPLEPPRDHPAAREARVLGSFLEIRPDVDQALGNRPAGRVLEVLKWIRQRRSTTNIRSVSSLFWSLVNKD